MNKIHTLTPASKDYLWGGNKLKQFYGKNTDSEILAESWELSTHRDGLCLIDGIRADEYIQQHPNLLGSACSENDIPILIKFIDAKQKLSLQVHPDDTYSRTYENDNGKTEMWYIVEAEPGAFIYYGLSKDMSLQQLRSAIENNTLTEDLNCVPVHAGETYLIRSGTLHAINEGCLILEIQERSNVTYRVSDYGRVGKDGKLRPLHVEQALKVTTRTKCATDPFPTDGNVICSTEYFTTCRYSGKNAEFNLDPNSFTCLTVTRGHATVCIGEERAEANIGQSLLFPCGEETVELSGDFEVLTVTVHENNGSKVNA